MTEPTPETEIPADVAPEPAPEPTPVQQPTSLFVEEELLRKVLTTLEQAGTWHSGERQRFFHEPARLLREALGWIDKPEIEETTTPSEDTVQTG